MPKTIPDLKQKILLAARRRMTESESGSFSIRQLAVDLGVAAGTIFNYFSSKEELMASVMLEDWQVCLEKMDAAARKACSPSDGFRQMESLIRAFSAPFRSVWHGYTRRNPIPQYHSMLIGQLRKPVGVLLAAAGRTVNDTELSVLSEMLLASSQREPGLIETLLPVMEKLWT